MIVVGRDILKIRTGTPSVANLVRFGWSSMNATLSCKKKTDVFIKTWMMRMSIALELMVLNKKEGKKKRLLFEISSHPY